MAGFLLLIGAGLVVWGLFWLSDLHDRASKYDRLKPRLDTLDELARSLDSRSAELTDTSVALDRKEKAVIVLSQQKAVGFPWLAMAYADFFHLEEMTRAALLERKKHPARKAA